MKKILLIMLLTLFAAVGVSAQKKHQGHRPPSKEMVREIQDFKLKYLIKELGITDSAEKGRFKETYSKMEQERREIFQQARTLERKTRKDKDATEADYEAASKAMTDAKVREGEIERKYDAIFSEFLTKKQIFKLKQAEEDFRQKMRELHQRKHKSQKK